MKKEIWKWMRVLSKEGRAEIAQELANARLAVQAKRAELEDEIKLARGQLNVAKVLYESTFPNLDTVEEFEKKKQELLTELSVIREGIKNGTRKKEEFVAVRDKLIVITRDLVTKEDFFKAGSTLYGKKSDLIEFDNQARQQFSELCKLLPTELLAQIPQSSLPAFVTITAIGKLYSDLLSVQKSLV